MIRIELSEEEAIDVYKALRIANTALNDDIKVINEARNKKIKRKEWWSKISFDSLKHKLKNGYTLDVEEIERMRKNLVGVSRELSLEIF